MKIYKQTKFQCAEAKKSSNLPGVTQLVCTGIRIQTQNGLSLQAMLLPLYHNEPTSEREFKVK